MRNTPFETALRASSGRTENRAIPFVLRSAGRRVSKHVRSVDQ